MRAPPLDGTAPGYRRRAGGLRFTGVAFAAADGATRRRGVAPRVPFPLISARSSRSSRSFGRPDARLFASNCSRPMTPTMRSPNCTLIRPRQACANDTPLMLVITSIRNGGRPIVAIRSGTAKSRARRPSSGYPKARRASATRRAFSVVGSIRMSRSPVARGRPWIASACAPTIRNRTRAADNEPMNSLHSRGTFTVDPPRNLAQCLDGRQPLFDRARHPIAPLRGGCLARGRPFQPPRHL